MKNFIQYLSESQKLYEFRIKVANCDPAEKMEELKAGLAGYVVDSISAPKTLPIKANDIDFPSMSNCEIFLMDASFKYPLNDAQLRAIVSERLCCAQAQVIVVPKYNPEEIWRWDVDGESELREFKQGEDVLTQPYPEATADQKAASKAYAGAETILKELTKPAKVEIAGNDHTTGLVKNPADGKTTNDLAVNTKSPVKGQA
jgi:hypothetical protein